MSIHGDKSQQERDWVLREFKTGKSPILVATDVAARGLDVEDIKFVVNYDYPNCSEDYVHRIGRTGRQDKRGTAYTFFTRTNSKQADDLIGVLREANQAINPKLFEMAKMGSRYGAGKYDRNRRWGFVPRDGARNGGSNGYGAGGNSYGKRKFDGESNGGSSYGSKRPYGAAVPHSYE